MDNEQRISDFIEAGKLGARIREDSKSLIMVGEPLLEIAETIEKMIYEEAARPAFPVNISLNELAAHYTPEFGCEKTLLENAIVKIDIGVSLGDGISDTAYTIDLGGENEKLVTAAKEALDAALAYIKPGVTNGSVGAIIEEKIRSYGFKPIANLSGHSIESNDLHAGVNIPNVKTGDNYLFQPGEIFAVEPFATNGAGSIEDTEQVEIFSLISKQPIRMRQSRQIFNHVSEKYNALPFAERWIRKEFPSKMLVSAALREMLSTQAIQGYPVLKETGGGMVSQFEHTILIKEDGIKILTK